MANEDAEISLKITAISEVKNALGEVVRQVKTASGQVLEINETQYQAIARRAQDTHQVFGKLLQNYVNTTLGVANQALKTHSNVVQQTVTQTGAVAKQTQLAVTNQIMQTTKAQQGYAAAVAQGASSVAHHLTAYAAGYFTLEKAIEYVFEAHKKFADAQRGRLLIQIDTHATTKQMSALVDTFSSVARLTGEPMEKIQDNFMRMREALGIEDVNRAAEIYEKVARAAKASGGSFEALSGAVVQSLVNLKVPEEKISEILDHWTKDIPASMQAGWSEAAPRITSTLRALGLEGADVASQVGAAFAAMWQKTGSKEQAEKTINTLFSMGQDISTRLGKEMIPQFEQIKAAGGTAGDQFNKSMEAMYRTVERTGYYEPGQGLAGKSMISRMLSVPRESLDALGEWKKRQEEITAETGHTGDAIGLNDRRLKELNKDDKSMRDRISAGQEGAQIGVGGVVGGVVRSLTEPFSFSGMGSTEVGRKVLAIRSAEVQLAALREQLAKDPGNSEMRAKEQKLVHEIEALRRNWSGSSEPHQGSGSEPHHAKGADFTVPGTGGTDETPVQFRATPGERVIVQPRDEVTRGSLQLQQDKADETLRAHFARFRGSDAKRKSMGVMASLGNWGDRTSLGGGAGGGGPGGGGPGGRGGGGGGGGGGGTGTGTNGAGELKVPTDISQGPNSLQEAYDRGFLQRPDAGGSGNLAEQRAKFMKEINADPKLKDFVIDAAKHEGGIQSNLEQIMNYASMRGMTIKQALYSGQYGPITGRNRDPNMGNISAQTRAAGEAALQKVGAGSNITDYATDQGMAGDPNFAKYMSNPQYWNMHKVEGAWFSHHNELGRKWAEQQRLRDQRAGAGGGMGAIPGMTTAGILGAVRGERVGGTGGSVEQAQGSAGVRRGAIDQRLDRALQYAADQAGVKVRITSGGQRMPGAPGATGSPRHNQGGAGDFDIIDPKTGQKLARDDPRRLKFLEEAAAAGAGGAGAGYMSDPLKVHMGITGSRGVVGEGMGAYAGNAAERAAIARGVARSKDFRFPDKAAAAGAGQPGPGGFTPGPVSGPFAKPAAAGPAAAKPSDAPARGITPQGFKAVVDAAQTLWDKTLGRPFQIARDAYAGTRYNVTPETPGQWSEEDEFRRQHAQQQEVDDAFGTSSWGLKPSGGMLRGMVPEAIPSTVGKTRAAAAAAAETRPTVQEYNAARSARGRPRGDSDAHIQAYNEMKRMRDEMEKPIEPVIKPRVEHTGTSRLRWNRVMERRRHLDNDREESRSHAADMVGFA